MTFHNKTCSKGREQCLTLSRPG